MTCVYTVVPELFDAFGARFRTSKTLDRPETSDAVLLREGDRKNGLTVGRGDRLGRSRPITIQPSDAYHRARPTLPIVSPGLATSPIINWRSRGDIYDGRMAPPARQSLAERPVRVYVGRDIVVAMRPPTVVVHSSTGATLFSPFRFPPYKSGLVNLSAPVRICLYLFPYPFRVAGGQYVYLKFDQTRGNANLPATRERILFKSRSGESRISDQL